MIGHPKYKEYSSDEDSEDKRKRKKRSKKINIDLPEKIFVLDNPDKHFHEKYEPGQSAIRFPHPFRCCILGQVNSGKSLMGTNIIIVRQAKHPKFQEIHVIHGCNTSVEYDALEPTSISDTIPSYEDFDEAKPKLLIIDDYDFTTIDKESKKRLSELLRFGSTHCNMSIIIIHQSWFRIPKMIKDYCNVFIIYKPIDLDEQHTIGRRVGLNKYCSDYLFEEYIKVPTDNITINTIPGAPFKFAKNIYDEIKFDPRKITEMMKEREDKKRKEEWNDDLNKRTKNQKKIAKRGHPRNSSDDFSSQDSDGSS